MPRRPYDFNSGELADEDKDQGATEVGKNADLEGEVELPADAPIAAHLRQIDRRIGTLTRLVLEIRADRAGDDPPETRQPSADELRCKRCGFWIAPLERIEGHECKRRSRNNAAWADRARAEIQPTVTYPQEDPHTNREESP